MHVGERHAPWFLWPFVAFFALLGAIVNLVGRFVAILLGLVLMAVGVILSLTIVGAVVGIPLMLLGFSLVVRGLF